MKKVFVLLLLCLLGSVNLKAQQASLLCNKFYANDLLERQKMSASEFNIQDADGVWSLENVSPLGKTFPVTIAHVDDSLMYIERGNRTLFHQLPKGQDLIGTEDNQTIITYDMPEKWLLYPMAYGDSISGYFSGTGKYCDSFFLRRFGTYWTKADAKGCLVLPSGDTLKNVIRLHTERYVSNISTSIDTLRHKIPTFTVDSIIKNMARDTSQIKESIYRWYAGSYRIPVLEAVIKYYGKKVTEQEVFYCSYGVQEQVMLDKMREGKKQVPDNANPDKNSPGIHYHIIRDEGNGHVNINYDLDIPMRVKVVLADIRGYVFQQLEEEHEAGYGYNLSLNTNGLRKGQYIIYINGGNNKYIEKFKLQ